MKLQLLPTRCDSLRAAGGPLYVELLLLLQNLTETVRVIAWSLRPDAGVSRLQPPRSRFGLASTQCQASFLRKSSPDEGDFTTDSMKELQGATMYGVFIWDSL
jgi:hypothetical protein